MAATSTITNCSVSAVLAAKLVEEREMAMGDDEATPSTAAPESEDDQDDQRSHRSVSSSTTLEGCDDDGNSSDTTVPRQLQPGPPPPPTTTVPRQLQPGPLPPTSTVSQDLPDVSACSSSSSQPRGLEAADHSACSDKASPETASQEVPQREFEASECFFIFDWDDTVLPSAWVQRQGLRLDAASQPSAEEQRVLAEVAEIAGKTLCAARRHGTVVLVTNAERGWIELSCQKFLPTLAPLLESVRLVSARTSYEGPQCPSPLDWKLRAFDAEITRFFGSEVMLDASRRKNVLSLGDSVHEREALLRATASVPNCCSKSMKFVERPDISEICKQHELISNCLDGIVQHKGDLDLCIRCP
jgi:hypothetical protein